jgi:hypothetical protein
MHYGEQAALVGVVQMIDPKLALEIGTYDGGSLALIAPFCVRVHTFDLASHVTDHLGNVEYHLGDSRVTVPALLAQLHARNESVDFALIDGDHSREGVHRDVRHLLDSPAVSRAMILLHDVANEAVRAGVRDAARGRPELAYVNLSFVPPWDPTGLLSEVWGGLGLLVVDKVGDFWPHEHRVDANFDWPTAIRRSAAWKAARPLRAARRDIGYRARPVIRKVAGVRGVKL